MKGASHYSLLLALLVFSMIFAVSSAHASTVQVRTLFLTDEIRPDRAPVQQRGSVQPHDMVAQQGEEEGFQLALKVPRSTRLEAWISDNQQLAQWTQILRVEWVNITRPSTAMGGRKGRFADPLPPQTGQSGVFNQGKLAVRANEWGGFVAVVSVPNAMAPGRYQATLNVRDESGQHLVAQPFALTVVATKAANGALDSAIAPHDPRNFKVLFNFSPNQYRKLAPAKTAQDQYEQTYRTLWMLARHRAAPTNWHRAYPSGDGTYSCSAANGYLKAYNDLPWWADGKPGAVPVALMPNHATERCTQGFTINKKRSSSKFDDVIGDVPQTAWFIYRVADHWRSSQIQDHRSYFLNTFDEPNQKQMRNEVPQLNKLVHDYAPGVKVLGTTWPMVKQSGQICRTVKGKRVCAKRAGQPSDNSNLRDGRGGDDLDGWVVPFFRMYGFRTSPAQSKVGMNRSREVLNRLKSVQKNGGEAWTYDLPLGTRKVPQMAIDAPATDARFMFWLLGREGFNGWYSAVTNRWVKATQVSQSRNPWDDPLSWVGDGAAATDGKVHTHSVVSNGWGSLYYPGYRPQVGLNDPLGQPVSSLRLQRLRDGVEDANLMRQYRDRFGQARLNKLLSRAIGGLKSPDNPRLPGAEVFPSYKTAGLALRMETARRQMLAELAN